MRDPRRLVGADREIRVGEEGTREGGVQLYAWLHGRQAPGLVSSSAGISSMASRLWRWASVAKRLGCVDISTLQGVMGGESSSNVRKEDVGGSSWGDM